MTAVARAVSEQRRSRTLGIVSAVGSLGTLLVPLATQALLARSGTPCIEKPFRVHQLISIVEKTFGKP